MLRCVVSQSIINDSKCFYALVRECIEMLFSTLIIFLTLQDVPGTCLSMMTLPMDSVGGYENELELSFSREV